MPTCPQPKSARTTIALAVDPVNPSHNALRATRHSLSARPSVRMTGNTDNCACVISFYRLLIDQKLRDGRIKMAELSRIC